MHPDSLVVRRTNRKLLGDARRVASTTGGFGRSPCHGCGPPRTWTGKVEEATIAERRAGGFTRTLKVKESKKAAAQRAQPVAEAKLRKQNDSFQLVELSRRS